LEFELEPSAYGFQVGPAGEFSQACPGYQQQMAGCIRDLRALIARPAP
jgi:hypothetical protein